MAKKAKVKNEDAERAKESGEELERKAAIKKVILTVNDDALASWLVQKKYNLDRQCSDLLIKDIRREITESSTGDSRARLGETLARLNEIYATAIKSMDAKTALAVQKELTKTQSLYNKFEDKAEETVDREKDAAREILESALEGTPKGTLTLDELAKALVYKLIQQEIKRNSAKRWRETPTAGKSA